MVVFDTFLISEFFSRNLVEKVSKIFRRAMFLGYILGKILGEPPKN